MPIVNVEGLASAGRDHRWGGARLGGFVGGVLGALTAFLMFEPEFIVRECNAGRSICGSGEQVRQVNSAFIESLKGAVPGILIGGTLGWFIGRRIPTETLEPLIATRDGALSMGFRIRR